MSRLSDFAVYCTSAHTAPFTALDGNSRLNVVKDFYTNKGLQLPASITVTSTTKVSRLNKDEKFAVSQAFALATLNGDEITDEMRANLIALSNPDASITTTKTAVFSKSVAEFGAAVVAAKLIDALDVTTNEEFHKIRKFDVPADVDVDEIPAFIKALQKIYDDAKKVESKAE